MLKVLIRYVAIIIAAFIICSFYFDKASVVAYNTRNLMLIDQTAPKDVLKLVQEK